MLDKIAIEKQICKARQFPALAHTYAAELDRLLRAAGEKPVTFSANAWSKESIDTVKRLGLVTKLAEDGEPKDGKVILTAESLITNGQRGEAFAHAFLNAAGPQVNALNLFYANHASQILSSRLYYLNKYLSIYDLGITLQEDGSASFFHRITPNNTSAKVEGPMVTVIMPAHNAESTIEFALESLLNQTWQNLQIIVVDDASTDSTLLKVKELAKRDARVAVLSSTVNVGPYVCRNLGVLHARGQWLTVHDADDWAFPGRIEQQVKALLYAKASACTGNMLRINLKGQITRASELGPISIDGYQRLCFASLMIEKNLFCQELGAWDSVWVSGDSEMLDRVKVLQIKTIHLTQPLMMCLDHAGSLTNHPKLGLLKEDGQIQKLRSDYERSYQSWHLMVGKKKLLPQSSGKEIVDLNGNKVNDIDIKKVFSTSSNIIKYDLSDDAKLGGKSVALAGVSNEEELLINKYIAGDLNKKISFCIPVKNRSKVLVEWNGITRKKTFISSYKDHPKKFELHLLKNCIKSIIDSKINRINIEIILVDFGSTDDPPVGWASNISHPGVEVKVIEVTGSFSRGRGLNIAAENSTGDIIFFLDADMLISKELILQTVKKNLIERKAFFPICYSYMTPFHKEGWIRSEGWGNLSVTREIYESKKIKWWEKKSWGSEDNHMRECLDGLYSREIGVNFFHQWHPEDDFKTQNYEKKKNKFDVVLGVTTYNRLSYLKDFVNSWLATRNIYYHWTLIFSDDGSTDGTLEYLENLNIENCIIHVIRHNRSGVHEGTNSIIDRSMSIDFDYGFKCDDDVIFLQKGWDDLYIDGMDTNPYICNYNLGWRNAKPKKLVEKFISYSDAYYSQGAFWTFTKQVINKIGWFDVKTFGYKGYGHIDYSVRACRAGFNSLSNMFDVQNSNLFIGLQSDEYKPALTVEEIVNDFGLVVDEEKKKIMRTLILEERAGVIFVKRDAIYSFSGCKQKPIIHFVIHNNHIGGAEYVHFNHALAMRDLGCVVKIWSVGKGIFFEKFVNSGFDIEYRPELFDKTSEDWGVFDSAIKDGNYIYNCNAYNDELFKELAMRRFFYYFTILHSDVDWIIKHQNNFKYFVHKYIVIHDGIKDNLAKSGVNVDKISTVNNSLVPDFPFGRNSSNNNSLRTFYEIPIKNTVVGFVGRIAKDKNVLDLLDIANIILNKRSDITFLIIGGVSQRASDKGYNEEFNEKLSAFSSNKNIVYAGEKSGEDLYSHLDLIDIAINVSPSEGLPISMLEQLAKGAYCIYPSFHEISRVLSRFQSATVQIEQRRNSQYLRYNQNEKEKFINEILCVDQMKIYSAKSENSINAENLFSFKNSLIQLGCSFGILNR